MLLRREELYWFIVSQHAGVGIHLGDMTGKCEKWWWESARLSKSAKWFAVWVSLYEPCKTWGKWAIRGDSMLSRMKYTVPCLYLWWGKKESTSPSPPYSFCLPTCQVHNLTAHRECLRWTACFAPKHLWISTALHSWDDTPYLLCNSIGSEAVKQLYFFNFHLPCQNILLWQWGQIACFQSCKLIGLNVCTKNITIIYVARSARTNGILDLLDLLVCRWIMEPRLKMTDNDGFVLPPPLWEVAYWRPRCSWCLQGMKDEPELVM